jgi:hypothetical protein
MADEATATTATEEQPPVHTPAGRTYTQADLDAITDKVRATSKAQTLKEVQEQAEAEKLTELDRAKKTAADESAARKQATDELARVKREALTLKHLKPENYAPPTYVERVIESWGDAEFDPVQAIARARELFMADATAAGLASGAGQKTTQTAALRSGTPASNATDDFSTWTSPRIQAEVRRLGMKSRADAEAFLGRYQHFFETGGKLADEV